MKLKAYIQPYKLQDLVEKEYVFDVFRNVSENRGASIDFTISNTIATTGNLYLEKRGIPASLDRTEPIKP